MICRATRQPNGRYKHDRQYKHKAFGGYDLSGWQASNTDYYLKNDLAHIVTPKKSCIHNSAHFQISDLPG